MATTELQMSPQLEQIHGEIRDNFRALSNGFQRLDKMKDSNRQSKQLEELTATAKMRECNRLIKEFDREIKDEESKNPPEVNKQLNDEKQSMIKELNSYVGLRKTYMNTVMKRDQLPECGSCGSPERFFLHNLRHRATYRRLCTNCVLKNHPGHFCPVCLEVFNESPPPHQRLICLKCPSISHLSCSSSSSLSQSFTCAPCANPNFSFFNITKSTTDHPPGSTQNGGENDDKEKKTRVIDKDAAKALIAAAKLASLSMTKAVAVAKMEAERRVKEATLAKKRAKEALDRLAPRMDNDRLKSSSPLSIPKSLPSPIHEKGNNGSYSVSGAIVAVPIPQFERQHSSHGMPN